MFIMTALPARPDDNLVVVMLKCQKPFVGKLKEITTNVRSSKLDFDRSLTWCWQEYLEHLSYTKKKIEDTIN